MAEREYNRLTWSHRRPGAFMLVNVGRASLWLGKDHILCIDTNGYTESYKRFYFRDIQAFTMYRTNTRLIWNIILGVLAAMFLLIGFATKETGGIITFSILASVFGLIPLTINLALGPSCKCQIRTAVQTEELPITRVGKARKVMGRLRPLIAAAQGQLTAEEISTRMQAVAAAIPAPAPPTATPASQPAQYVIDEPNLPPRITS